MDRILDVPNSDRLCDCENASLRHVSERDDQYMYQDKHGYHNLDTGVSFAACLSVAVRASVAAGRAPMAQQCMRIDLAPHGAQTFTRAAQRIGEHVFPAMLY